MKIESNGKSYHFAFQHGFIPVMKKPHRNKKTEYTSVTVVYNDQEYCGTVRKYHKDKSNKVTARTIALLKAIKELPEDDRKFIFSTIPIRKDRTVSL